jgi:hypothetical protein
MHVGLRKILGVLGQRSVTTSRQLMVCYNIPKSGERWLAEVLQCLQASGSCAGGCVLFLPQEGLHARELINIFISVLVCALMVCDNSETNPVRCAELNLGSVCHCCACKRVSDGRTDSFSCSVA